MGDLEGDTHGVRALVNMVHLRCIERSVAGVLVFLAANNCLERFGKMLLQSDDSIVCIGELLFAVVRRKLLPENLFEHHQTIQISDLVLCIQTTSTGNGDTLQQFE